MLFGLSIEIWVVIGLGFLIFMLLMSGLARLYRKAGPHEALIVYGFRNKRVVVGRGTIVWPVSFRKPCDRLSIHSVNRLRYSPNRFKASNSKFKTLLTINIQKRSLCARFRVLAL